MRARAIQGGRHGVCECEGSHARGRVHNCREYLDLKYQSVFGKRRALEGKKEEEKIEVRVISKIKISCVTVEQSLLVDNCSCTS